MFSKILIANRGEIACRVITTARRLGIKTVAVYSDADRDAKHVAMADEAVHIGGAAPKDSYLRADAVIAAAKATGAQAVHPGYGFLSENEDFAQSLAREGIVFIGPPASAIAAMGSKSAAKSLMEKAGVPLTPGYHGDNQDPAFLKAEADKIGYPVIIKAAAGGGGKGMRVVTEAIFFADALASCKREAINAFGDDKVLVEKYVTRPRHIEIQVFADTQGNAVYCFERDCSLQRRHQKVLEEAPAPGMTPERRAAMGEAAVAAAMAVGYVGAGTVEFIVEQAGPSAAGPQGERSDAFGIEGASAPSGGSAGANAPSVGGFNFYFMEMNTRLQVEHPVTEMVIGHDLVEWQLRVAAGEPLPVRQEQLRITGHAIEARVYAEHPEGGFLPSTGTLTHLHFPAHSSFTRNSAVRVDSGVRSGDTITPFYDPMIAKLIVWGEDRAQALARLAAALDATHIVGPKTNVAFLARCVRNAAFASGSVHTGLIEQERAELLPAATAPGRRAVLLAIAKRLAEEVVMDSHDPWNARTGFRIAGSATRNFVFEHETGTFTIPVRYPGADEARYTALIDGESVSFEISPKGSAPVVSTATGRFGGEVIARGEELHVFESGTLTVLTLVDSLAHAGEDAGEGGRLTAPMPGKIVAVLAQPGAAVEKGAPLVVMEAMKMEHTITAPAAGVLEEVLFAVGDQVTEGAQLVRFAAKG
ncbi:3-methylcrotonyl-CoA carboxylase [beta proteobacterium AAP99]|nr:3-methylcrotonyl-CoA carboxylase [beta proteobacterium AAP99]